MENSKETEQIPRHVAVIMDGNGRWAKKRFVAKSVGHRAGGQALKEIALEAEKMGIQYMTVYAFSTENWKRSKEEVDSLMDLLREYIKQYINDAKKNNTRISIIGERSRIDDDLKESISHLEELTKNKTGLHLLIALDYGGRDEIARAVTKICRDVLKCEITQGDINEELISNYMDTAGMPDPELLIRTSGELRLSNFLLWQFAYTEFYFTDKLWPDFKAKDLRNAIEEYQRRQRRFGAN